MSRTSLSSVVHRGWKTAEAEAGAVQSKEPQNPRATRTLPHMVPSLPGSHCCLSSPSSDSWLGRVAGVAPEIKIDPQLAELGCHSGR